MTASVHDAKQEALRRVRRQARRLDDAKAGRDAAIREAVAAGLSLAVVAGAAGLTKARVGQIVSPP